jgi:hypothetical protein
MIVERRGWRGEFERMGGEGSLMKGRMRRSATYWS